MRLSLNKVRLIGLILCLALIFSGCSTTSTGIETTEASSVLGTEATTESSEVKSPTALESVIIQDEDRELGIQTLNSTQVQLNDQETRVDGTGVKVNGNQVTITQEGTYVISGSLSNGQLIIDIDKEDKVKLVFNGVAINSQMGPAVWIKSAEKVIVTLVDGTFNTLADSDMKAMDEEAEELDAAFFSNEDLTINGGGSLAVTGILGSGIKSKDTLLIVSGSIEVNAKTHGLNGKDALLIYDGILTLVTGEDGLHSNNQVYIGGGETTINAGDDGIHGDLQVLIDNGQIRIHESYEGIEAESIIINEGSIEIQATDDGINATEAGEAGTESLKGLQPMTGASLKASLTISGGQVAINASGDGLDSNGNIAITGGITTVSGPTSGGDGALDYNGECLVSGGTLAIAGSAGMAQAPSAESSQVSILLYYTVEKTANESLSLLNDQGEVILTYVPQKNYSTILISSPEMTIGKTYTLVDGGELSKELVQGFAAGGTLSGSRTVTEITPTESTTIISEDGSEVVQRSGPGGMKGDKGLKPEFGGQPPVKR